MTGDFSAWVGKVEKANDTVSPAQARQMTATLDPYGVPGRSLGLGDPLPLLWHWLGWLPDAPMSGLGPDGHPQRGGFLPPVPLERRMWAGGRLTFHSALRIGQPMQRRSEIVSVTEKQGSTGAMVFVTVRHDVTGPNGLALTEDQDIVYLPMPDRFAPSPPVAAPTDPDWTEVVDASTVRLFRFSALTFNAHRIHYDADYAAKVEKYPGLVVHGPLQAMLLIEAAQRRTTTAPTSFRFRGLRPALHNDPLTLLGRGPDLYTATPDGTICMQAQITWGQA